MARKNLLFLLLAPILLLLTATPGLSDPGGLALGLKAGTLGGGLEGTAGLLPRINLRAGANTFRFNFDTSSRDNEYRMKTRLLSFPIVLDWHPFKTSAFRVSSGMLLNYNEADARGTTQDSITIGSTTYTADQVGKLTGKVDFNKIAPYAGIGWGNALGKTGRWSLSCDIGVVFQGKARVDMFASGPIASDPNFQADLEREKRDLKERLDDYKYYPVIALGINYRF